MNPAQHATARCQNGENCTGAGCRINTGKTQRKANWKRPKPNKHESTRTVQKEARK